MNDNKEGIYLKLSKLHDLDEVAIWHITGEGSVYDFGRPLHVPSLGYVKGKYRHVVEYALSLQGFVTWGSGGKIEPVNVMEVDATSLEQITEAREKVRQLTDELHNATEVLKRLEG